MAYLLTCDGCGAHAVAEEHPDCPPDPNVHIAACQMNNLDGLVQCRPGFGCCEDDHDHAAAANSCKGGHGACPEPESCALHASVKAHFEAAQAQLADHDGQAEHFAATLEAPPDTCRGGHCHKDLADCAVCRPITILGLRGSAVLTPAAGV